MRCVADDVLLTAVLRCKLHDQVVNQGATTFEYKYRRMNGQYFYYSVDLTLMVQENTTTGTIRQIRRLVPGPSRDPPIVAYRS